MVRTIRADERSLLIKHTVQYILNQSAKKLSFKRADIVKNCLHEEQPLFDEIFPAVDEQLEEVYGVKVHEVKDEKNAKLYLCIASETASSEDEYTLQQRRESRLLFLVLTYIFMKNNEVMDSTLFAFLRKMDIDDEPHEFFGYFKKTINETFIKQMYLKREKYQMESADNEDRVQFSWGLRANLEFDKKAMLDNVAELMNKPVETFTAQYTELYASDNEEEAMDIN